MTPPQTLKPPTPQIPKTTWGPSDPRASRALLPPQCSALPFLLCGAGDFNAWTLRALQLTASGGQNHGRHPMTQTENPDAPPLVPTVHAGQALEETGKQ